jgi:predicted sulfurtransferase
MKNKIIIYYKYITIPHMKEVLKWQKELCQKLALKGRIILATEGINGTLGGSSESVLEYQTQMNDHELFNGIDFKESEGGSEKFPRLSIKIRNEIVSFSRYLKVPLTETPGIYLTAQEAHELMAQNSKDVLVFDIRNTYESRIGVFQNALKADIENFRDLPLYIDQNKTLFKDKKVIMNCTSGVRCEPGSAYLKSLRIAQEVYHIKGGIQRYAEQYPNGFFRGKNYVFDGRIALKVNDDILTTCDLCPQPYDTYSNCINTQCNKQIIICPTCTIKASFTCNDRCLELVQQAKVKVRKNYYMNTEFSL